MRIVDKYGDNGALFYTVELEEDVFVDVKCDMDLCYMMDCEDGYEVYNSDGNTFDYHYDADEVIAFVKSMTTQKSDFNGGFIMYVICYTLANGENTYEIVSGEDAMQIRVGELMDDLLLYEDEVMVFEMDSQLK